MSDFVPMLNAHILNVLNMKEMYQFYLSFIRRFVSSTKNKTQETGKATRPKRVVLDPNGSRMMPVAKSIFDTI